MRAPLKGVGLFGFGAIFWCGLGYARGCFIRTGVCKLRLFKKNKGLASFWFALRTLIFGLLYKLIRRRKV